jgi:ABC-type branched-subunit amino acid transport system substrate-binding protein
VSPFTAGADKKLVELFEAQEVPVVGPLTLLPQAGSPTKRHTFYLYSGPVEQAQALFLFAVNNLNPRSRRVAVVCPDSEVSAGLTALAEDQAKKLGLDLVAQRRYGEGKLDAVGTAAELRDAHPDTVLFFGSSTDERDLAREMDKLKWLPNLLLIGSLAGKEMFDLPAGFEGKVFLSYPTLPSDRSEEGMEKFVELARKYQLSSQHLTSQIAAFCAAEVLTQGLKLAGNELTRERLVAALEGLNQFETGLTPQISYGPNRRIGALGAYVVGIDLEKKQITPASGWIRGID